MIKLICPARLTKINLSPRGGGKNGGGAILTPFGTSPVARYREIERAAANAAHEPLQA